MKMAEKEIVVPGDKLPPDTIARDPAYVYEVNGEKIAAVIGILDKRGEKPVYIPLQTIYVPKPGDIVIGLITSVAIVNWYVDINSPYIAVLSASEFLGRPPNPQQDELSKYLQVGDYIKARVVAFDRARNPILSLRGDKGEELGKITKGKIIEIDPARVPRVIGKKGSMLEMLKEETGCNIFVAVNGRIHIECSNPDMEPILVLAIKMIEEKAHVSGLTDMVRKYIEELKVVRGVNNG